MYIKCISQDMVMFEHFLLVDIISHILCNVNSFPIISFHCNLVIWAYVSL